MVASSIVYIIFGNKLLYIYIPRQINVLLPTFTFFTIKIKSNPSGFFKKILWILFHILLVYNNMTMTMTLDNQGET